VNKPLWKRKDLLLAFFIGISYGTVLYWCYMPNTITCLYCNQPVVISTDMCVCFDHQNVIHFDCAGDMREMLDLTSKSTADFLRTK